MKGEPAKSVALEALKKVKETEEKARNIILEAQDKISARIVREASENAKKIREIYLAKAKEEAQAMKKNVIEQALQEAERIRSEAEAEAALLRQRAAASMAEAVKKVSRRIKEFLRGEPI